MKNNPKKKNGQLEGYEGGLFALKSAVDIGGATDAHVHSLGHNIICRTDYRAHKRSPLELVLDATEGFIPLWEENLVLRWKFNEASLAAFQHADAIKESIRNLLGKAISAWGDAMPIRFTENSDNSDFEIQIEHNDDCSPQGCTLAQAFFPDSGRHPLYIYPKMFSQDEKEQVDTLTHELGHVFGLRHFFAPDTETQWPSVIFGKNKPFSIMNYGQLSELTEDDKHDLKLLYESVWGRRLTKINDTPIKLVRPYHYFHP